MRSRPPDLLPLLLLSRPRAGGGGGSANDDAGGDTDSEYGGDGHNGGEEMTRLAAGSIIATVFALVGGIAYRLFRHRRKLPPAVRP
jgi:hypothetical protein|eukprot:COSAG06_NODE_739_length_12671_cov_28.300907_12_plen_86_part_00